MTLSRVRCEAGGYAGELGAGKDRMAVNAGDGSGVGYHGDADWVCKGYCSAAVEADDMILYDMM